MRTLRFFFFSGLFFLFFQGPFPCMTTFYTNKLRLLESYEFQAPVGSTQYRCLTSIQIHLHNVINIKHIFWSDASKCNKLAPNTYFNIKYEIIFKSLSTYNLSNFFFFFCFYFENYRIFRDYPEISGIYLYFVFLKFCIQEIFQ